MHLRQMGKWQNQLPGGAVFEEPEAASQPPAYHTSMGRSASGFAGMGTRVCPAAAAALGSRCSQGVSGDVDGIVVRARLAQCCCLKLHRTSHGVWPCLAGTGGIGTWRMSAFPGRASNQLLCEADRAWPRNVLHACCASGRSRQSRARWVASDS